MAFQTENTAQQMGNVAPITGRNDQWKADAFVNIYLPTRDGGRRKLGYIPLKTNKPLDKQLLDHIADADDLDTVLDQIKDRIVLDFQRADGNNGSELDL